MTAPQHRRQPKPKHDAELASVLTAIHYVRDRLRALSLESDGEQWWTNDEWQRILRETVAVIITPDDQERLINPDDYLVGAIAAALDKLRVYRDEVAEAEKVQVRWSAPEGTDWPDVQLRVTF